METDRNGSTQAGSEKGNDGHVPCKSSQFSMNRFTQWKESKAKAVQSLVSLKEEEEGNCVYGRAGLSIRRLCVQQ